MYIDAVQTSSLLEESNKVLSWAGNAVLAENHRTNKVIVYCGINFGILGKKKRSFII